MKKPGNIITNDFVKYRYIYLALFLCILVIILTLPATMKGADGKEYLRWTHSLVFDRDIHLLNNLESVGGGYKLTPTGYTFERVNIGAPLMWMPFYGIAGLFLPDSTDNLPPAAEPIQLIWLNVSSWLYPVLGGLLMIGGLRRIFPARIVAATLATTLLGTPLLFYMMTYPMSVHPALIFLTSLFFYLWITHQTIDQSTARLLNYLTMGIVIGWLLTTASYNVVYFLLPGFDLLKELTRHKNWRQTLLNGLGVSFGGFLGFVPQMITWWFLFGNPLYSPYSGQLFWTEPYFLETLFSTFHGLFFYAPVLLLVIPGLWWLGKCGDRWRAAAIGLVWLTLTYIVSINVAWWAGASFGNRYFLALTPLFVLGLAQFIQHLQKWAWLFIVPTVLWTVGLYLQFLNGVGFTSDSIVFSAVELARGQLPAFANIFNILSTLSANTPWALVPPLTIPAMILVIIFSSRLLYGWITTKPQPPDYFAYVIAILGLVVIGFMVLAGFRGEQAKTELVEQGFFDQPHQTIMRETKEVAGKAGLVTRAMYHRQTGQPAQAIADLQLASQLWKSDTTARPTRLYLGPETTIQDIPLNLGLNYVDSNVRLLGFEISEANQQSITGELFWEKLDAEETKDVVTPIVRAFDRHGNLLGLTTIESPFPAEYIPAGHHFKDEFMLPLNDYAGEWMWLDVRLMDNFELPLDAQNDTNSGFIVAAQPGIPPEIRQDVDWICSPDTNHPPICTMLQADISRRYRPAAPQNPLESQLTETITLKGYDLSIIPDADSMMARLVLHWYADNSVDMNYQVTIQLLDDTGQPVISQTGQPVNNSRPTTSWLKGEWLLDEYRLSVPLLPAGTYQLTLSLIGDQTAPKEVELKEIIIP